MLPRRKLSLKLKRESEVWVRASRITTTRVLPYVAFPESGAGKEARTPDLNLGKVALYQLSYSRDNWTRIIFTRALVVKESGRENACFIGVY